MKRKEKVTMNNHDIWTEFLNKIKSKVSLMSYNCLFKDLKLHSYENNELIIVVPNNDLMYQNITKNYKDIIEDLLNDITNNSLDIKFIFENEVDKYTKKEPIIQNETEKEENIINENIENYKYSSNFNPKYTFDTFVVGEANKLAYGTALVVAQNPGKLYNPYFIYAKSGLGKTHLMHAIGNYIVNHSDKKVLYITAEQFINDYVSIVNTKNKNDNNVSYLEAFREKYRNVDVLMIDDIQFLEKANKTQMEFTNTFNTLYNNEKQIIIASDRSINDYKLLEERLKTRFKGGLTDMLDNYEKRLRQTKQLGKKENHRFFRRNVGRHALPRQRR